MENLRRNASESTIQPDARVKARQELEIAAPAEVVWTTLSNIDGWKDWVPQLTHSKLTGPLAPASTFRWGGSPAITSELVVVASPRTIAWVGSMLWIKAVHVWTIEEVSPGKCRVVTQESLDGFAVSMMMGDEKLSASLKAWLAALKVKAEAASP